METMVEIKNLCKQFGPFTAVDDISFSVKRGEVLGFLGPNGAGKSTTMKMITGFLTPTSGNILVGGDNVERHPLKTKSRIGYLPEGAPAYPDMTPGSFLTFISAARGFRGAEKSMRVQQTIERVNLEKVVNQPIETLSKGFKRRVGLAQAILHDPEVLILDEPTDGLDPNQKHEVRNLIKDMAEDKVIILSTHILEEVDAVCSRAIIIADGKLVADGSPSDLEAKSRYHNAVTISLQCESEPESSVRESLMALGNIDEVEFLQKNEQCLSFRAFPKDATSIISSVSHLARDKNWDVQELHVEQGRLDEVFRKLTGTGAPSN